MATRAQTLQIFADLLASEQPANIEKADHAVWTYLAPLPGLKAQTDALESLTRGVAELDASSAFMPILLDALERHRARLAEPQA